MVDDEIVATGKQRPHGVVDVVAAEGDRPRGDEPPEGEDADVGRPAADLDHHRPRRLLDRERGPDGTGQRQLHEADLAGTGLAQGPVQRAVLDLRRSDVRAHEDPGVLESGYAGAAEHLAEHLLGEGEVEELAAADRTDDAHPAGGARTDAERLVAKREQPARIAVDRRDGRLVEEQTTVGVEDAGAGGPEVERQIRAQ